MKRELTDSTGCCISQISQISRGQSIIVPDQTPRCVPGARFEVASTQPGSLRISGAQTVVQVSNPADRLTSFLWRLLQLHLLSEAYGAEGLDDKNIQAPARSKQCDCKCVETTAVQKRRALKTSRFPETFQEGRILFAPPTLPGK